MPKLNRDWRPRFLAALERHGQVSLACKAARISRTAAYNARKADPDFAEAWSSVEAMALDEVERSLFRRAVAGEVAAAIFILKSKRAESYGDGAAIEQAVERRLALFGSDLRAEVAAMPEDERQIFQRAVAGVKVKAEARRANETRALPAPRTED